MKKILLTILFLLPVATFAQSIPTISPWLVDSGGNVTQRTINAIIKITGLSDGCLNITSGIVGSQSCSGGGGGNSFAWPFTPATHWGQNTQGTTTALWLQGSPFSLFASSTSVFTQASTSMFTISGQPAGCGQFDSTGLLTSTGVNCGSGSGGNSFGWPFDAHTGYVSTSTAVGFLNGIFSTASSTFSGNLYHPNIAQGFLYTGSAGIEQTIASSSVKLSWFNNDSGFITSTGIYPINSIITSNGSGALIATGTQLTSGNFLATTTAINTFPEASTTNITSTGYAAFATGGGNVGVGTALPSAIFDVVSSNGSSISMENFSASLGAGLNLRDGNAATNLFTSVINPAGASNANLPTTPLAATFQTGGGTTGGIIFVAKAASSPIIFATGGSTFANERMRIDGNGNLGIGTTLPTTKLEVQGGILATASSTFSSTISLSSLGQGFAYIGSGSQVNSIASSSVKLSWFNNDSGFLTGVVSDSPLSGSGTSGSHLVLSTAGTWSGNAVTASALAANGTNCSAGSYPLGVDASGNSENCTVANTGTVTSVTATYPILSTGGNTPVISTAFGTTTNAGIGNDLFLYTSHTGVILGVASSSLSLPNTALQNSTISGVTLGNTLGALSHDSSLAGTSYTGTAAVSDWGLALNHTNTWSVLQNFNYSSSTIYSSFLTASSTFLNAGSLTIATSSPGCAAFMSSGLLTSIGAPCGSGGGSGTVTSITAGDSLLGGTITTSGTLYGAVGTSSTPIINPANLAYWTTAGDATHGAHLGSVATSSLSGGGPITVSNNPVIIGGSTATLGCTNASSGVTGCLTGTDWNTFNNKGNGTVTSFTAGAGHVNNGTSFTVSGTLIGAIATSATPVINPAGLAYWTGVGNTNTPATLGTTATGTISNGTNITVTNGSTASVIGSNITIGVSGQIAIGNGGTNASSCGNTNGAWYFDGTRFVCNVNTTANTLLVGSNSAPVFSASPTLGTSLTTPLIIGGTGVGSTLTLESTSGVGSTDSILFKTGPSQNTQGEIASTGQWGIGTSTSPFMLDIASTTASATFKPQLALTDTSAAVGSKHWTLANEGGNLYIGTSTDLYATSSPAAITITPGGFPKGGIGTTTPFSLWSIINGSGAATPLFSVSSSTATGSAMPTFEIDATGRAVTSGPVPVLSSCGTTPTIVGNDQHMVVTVGSVAATACTITFATAYATAPVVNVTNRSMSITNAMTYTVSASAITVSQTALTGDVLDINVFPIQ